ncbi:hypothetical protein [Burkholderia reimsis]|nr:hypothetical protein [Burkholderia reimsis]
MEEEDLKRRIDALGTSAPVSSKIARLRALYDHIDAALGRGATRQDVLDVLNSDGFNMTMASFKSALQRIRAERKETHEDALTNTPGSNGDCAATDRRGMGTAFAELLATQTRRRWDGKLY